MVGFSRELPTIAYFSLQLQMMWDDSRSAGTLSTTMEVLLGACIGFNFDQIMVYGIKDQVFQFIRTSGRLP